MTLATADLKGEEEARRRSLEMSLHDITVQLRELTGLRIRGLLTDVEFLSTRENLQKEGIRLRGKLDELNGGLNSIEPFGEIISFRNRAARWFMHGQDDAKRMILASTGSNLFLKDRIVSIEAKKPFLCDMNSRLLPRRLGVVDDVRIFRRRFASLAKEIINKLHNEDGKAILRNIKTLREQFEPTHLPLVPRPDDAQAA
jgi:hypothetical protein